MQPFIDACLAAPIGAALVAQLEVNQRPSWTRIVDDPGADTELIRRAAEHVGRISFGQLCEVAIRASEDVGPWTPGADEHAYAVYQHAEQRRPIAAAINDRFGAELHAGIALDGQEWWIHSMSAAGIAPLFRHLDQVYGRGELSWHALRAYGPSPSEVLDSGFGEAPTPSTRWSLPVVKPVRALEIHRPADWFNLCSGSPREGTEVRDSWALPGPYAARNQRLMGLRNQHAAVAVVDVHLNPMWSVVARDFDAVHLSWAGFITSEGFVFQQGRITTMLRYWEREVTMWLKDCFGTPEPLPLPPTHDDHPYSYVMDATTSPSRRAQDEGVIADMLARP